MTDKITVERTGRRPLRFVGEQIAHADSGNHDSGRWTVATVYRRPMRWTDDRPCWEETRGWVLATVHRTRWDGERDQREAIVCDSAGELAANIEELPAAVADELLGELGIVDALDARAAP